MYYTQDQIDRANQADLVTFLQSQGEQLTRAGTDLAPRPSPTSGYRPAARTTEQRGTTSQQPAALMKM